MGGETLQNKVCDSLEGIPAKTCFCVITAGTHLPTEPGLQIFIGGTSHANYL